MPDDRGGSKPPDYKVYRSRGGPLSKLRPGERLGNLPRSGRDGGRRAPREPKGGWSTRRKVITAIVGLLLGWVLLSVVLFFISAQTAPSVSDETEEALSPGGSLLTGSTVMVLGSDRRPGESKSEGNGRADSILLLHVGIGTVRRLSILRDSLAEIPGHGTDLRINTAYQLGGPPLMIETVEGFLGNGLEINHVVEVSFSKFPDLIDALGGVTVNNPSKICSPVFDSPTGEFDLEKGEHHLDGVTALSFARVRTNPCAPGEDDRARAERQQEVLSGMREQLLSPMTFVRLPWVSWAAPQTVRSDLRGPGLAALFASLATGGAGETRVLQPDELSLNSGGGLTIPEEEKTAAVQELLGQQP